MVNRLTIFLLDGMEESGYGQIDILSWDLTGRTEENYKKSLSG
jgi:hypothetical protein